MKKTLHVQPPTAERINKALAFERVMSAWIVTPAGFELWQQTGGRKARKLATK